MHDRAAHQLRGHRRARQRRQHARPETETVCDLQQRQRDEPDPAGELSITTWDIFFPAGTEVDTGDAVIVGSYVYELLGDPWDANQGSAAVNHVAATVRRTAEVVVS